MISWKNDRLAMNDLDFVDNCNVLDFVSGGTTDFVPQLYLTGTVQFKRISVELKKHKRN